MAMVFALCMWPKAAEAEESVFKAPIFVFQTGGTTDHLLGPGAADTNMWNFRFISVTPTVVPGVNFNWGAVFNPAGEAKSSPVFFYAAQYILPGIEELTGDWLAVSAVAVGAYNGRSLALCELGAFLKLGHLFPKDHQLHGSGVYLLWDQLLYDQGSKLSPFDPQFIWGVSFPLAPW